MKTETLGEANSPEEAQRLMQEGKLGDFERFDLVDTRYRDQAQTPLSLEVKAGSNATQEFDVGAPIREPVRMPGT
ncbi:MAG: hypothetical protein IJ991_18875 [Thermoguttaceae bacterium]|nr:hypothetical protein [Thermoguttaceae bacterium]